MLPITTLTVAAKAAELGKKLYEVAKGLKDRETQQRIDEVIDDLRELKQQASELEDENRELREKLRFKSDAYVFVRPFYYDRVNDPKHETPFCPKCFVDNKIATVGKPFRDYGGTFRTCHYCSTNERTWEGWRFFRIQDLNGYTAQPMSIGQVIQSIDEQISKLQQVRGILNGSGAEKGTGMGRGPRTMSAAVRARIAAAQKARWARVRAQGKKK